MSDASAKRCSAGRFCEASLNRCDPLPAIRLRERRLSQWLKGLRRRATTDVRRRAVPQGSARLPFTIIDTLTPPLPQRERVAQGRGSFSQDHGSTRLRRRRRRERRTHEKRRSSIAGRCRCAGVLRGRSARPPRGRPARRCLRQCRDAALRRCRCRRRRRTGRHRRAPPPNSARKKPPSLRPPPAAVRPRPGRQGQIHHLQPSGGCRHRPARHPRRVHRPVRAHSRRISPGTHGRHSRRYRPHRRSLPCGPWPRSHRSTRPLSSSPPRFCRRRP